MRKIKLKRTELIPLGLRANWMEARQLARERKMKLAPHLLLDSNLRSNGWVELKEKYGLSSVWADEVIVHPPMGERIKKEDIIDSKTGWIFPARYIPNKTIKGVNVGFFVVPAEPIEDLGGVIPIHPESLIVLHPFLQLLRSIGRMDKHTGIPLTIPDKLRKKVSDEAKRTLDRIMGAGVRPIVRHFSETKRATVDLTVNPSEELDVLCIDRDESIAEDPSNGVGNIISLWSTGVGSTEKAATIIVRGQPSSVLVEESSVPLETILRLRGASFEEFVDRLREAMESMRGLSEIFGSEDMSKVIEFFEMFNVKRG